jgi:hypothetical protein
VGMYRVYRVYPICGPFHWKRYSKNDKEMTRHVRKSPLGTHQRPHIAMLAVARSWILAVKTRQERIK